MQGIGATSARCVGSRWLTFRNNPVVFSRWQCRQRDGEDRCRPTSISPVEAAGGGCMSVHWPVIATGSPFDSRHRDRAVIALWLGHEPVETTYVYLHADLKLKEQAMARTVPSHMRPPRYRPEDNVLVFEQSVIIPETSAQRARSPPASGVNPGIRRIREQCILFRNRNNRHTFASTALVLGESLPMIGKLLGHSKGDTTARYAHRARDSVHVSAARTAASIATDILGDGWRNCVT